MAPRAIQALALLLCCTAVGAYNYYMPSSYIDPAGNIAVGKTATQSSQYDSYSVASRAVDGYTSGWYNDGTCSHTKKQGDSAWLTVDLEDPTTKVEVVKLFNRLDYGYANRLLGVEIRVGNETVTGSGDQNPLCLSEYSEYYEMDEDNNMGYTVVPTLFRCDNSTGRYVTVRLPRREYLHICEVMIFDEPQETQYVIQPQVDADEGCKGPLKEACDQYKDDGMSDAAAHVKAFMEGPINCGDKGFFCRMKKDPAGKNGGMTGTPGDDFVGNENYGYCVDRDEDRRIDWNNLGRQPRNNDGHCHGSEFDSSYIGVLHDHYYRPYRGDLECCCGLEKRDEDGDWAPAKNYISRCDYRGLNANNAAENFEGGCGRDMTEFYGKDEFPNATEMCWELKNFGRPPNNVHVPAPYAVPTVESPFCQGGEGDWTGCVIQVDSRSLGNAVVMVAPEKVAPRMIDRLKYCEEVYDVEISEVGLQLIDYSHLDKHGHESDFVRLYMAPGQTAFIQVMDRETCTVSDTIQVDVPDSDARKRSMRKML